MSVSEQRGHIKEPPLGGESGPDLAEWEDEEDGGRMQTDEARCVNTAKELHLYQ